MPVNHGDDAKITNDSWMTFSMTDKIIGGVMFDEFTHFAGLILHDEKE